MRQGRHGIKVLGLSLLAALGLMAFAASAQAGEYTINEGGVHKTFTEHGIAQETVEGTVAHGTLLVPALGLTILCTGGMFSGTILLGGTAHASVLYSGCEAVSAGATCKPFETKAKMETNLAADKGFFVVSGLGELLLMGGKHYLLVSGVLLGEIYWPKLCALTLENMVAGSTVFELPTALELGLIKQTIVPLLEEVIKSLFPSDILTYGNGTQLAWLHPGTATAHLSGALKGKFWGAH